MQLSKDPALWDAIHAERAKGHGKRAIAAALAARGVKVGATTVQRYLDSPRPGERAAGAVEPPPAAVEERRFEEKADGTAVLHKVTSEPIKTLADLIRVCEIDQSVWYVERYDVGAWTNPLNLKRGQTARTLTDAKGRERTELGWEPSEAAQQQQFKVTAHLRRIVSRAVHDALKLVFAEIRDAAPRWPKIDRERPGKDEPYLAVFGLFDVHFGKLCWDRETGENYDLRIAQGFLGNAVEDLIAESRHRRVTKILLPFGNDWLHVDNRKFETTRGTPQDVDGRFSKVFAAAKLSALKAVEMMAAVAPVQVELMPGNHDRTLAECLCHVIDAYFHRTDRVTVNLDPRTRKYVRFGTTLLGLAHGDLVKPEKLPGLMPADAKRDWAETTCHEWLTGHGHVPKKWTTQDVDSQPGVVVRQLRALTRTDLWHFDSGYVGSNAPGAECYWYGRDRGYAGHTVVPARAG